MKVSWNGDVLTQGHKAKDIPVGRAFKPGYDDVIYLRIGSDSFLAFAMNAAVGVRPHKLVDFEGGQYTLLPEGYEIIITT